MENNTQARIAAERSRLNSAIATASTNVRNIQSKLDEQIEIIKKYSNMIEKMSGAKGPIDDSAKYLSNAKDDYNEGYESQYNTEQKQRLLEVGGSMNSYSSFLQGCIDAANEKLQEHQRLARGYESDLTTAKNNLSNLQSQLYALNHGAY